MPVDQPATTRAGLTRQRMSWTTEMNEHIMRCYYKITALETFTTGYRTELRRMFLEKYPDYQMVTEQRLVDQKRVIIKNKRLSPVRIEEIKNEIAQEINENTTIEGNETQEEITHHTPLDATEENINQISFQNNITPVDRTDQPQEVNQMEKLIDTCLQKNLIEWSFSEPRARPPITKLQFNKHTSYIVQKVNEMIKTLINKETTLNNLHTIIYCSARTIIEVNTEYTTKNGNNEKINKPSKTESYTKNKRKPRWQIRIENNISNLRKDIGRLTQYLYGNKTKRVTKKTQHLRKNLEPIETTLDTLKQKLSVYSARLRRYQTSNNRKYQNKLFQNNEKAFYQNLNKTDFKINPPTQDAIENFWASIWGQERQHKQNAPWITKIEQQQQNIPEQVFDTITAEELTTVIQKTHNWKAPGIDHLHNFWYKKLTSTHEQLAKVINEIIHKPQSCPLFLTEGKTYIKPKNENTSNPSNYRPITCLPTLYKIITSILTHRIQKHLTDNNILTEEQKGCRKHSQGCKEQLIIDNIILNQTQKNQRNLTVSYIDYKKAFDSVPHTWLMKVLEIYKISPTIRNLLSVLMAQWRTRIYLQSNDISLQTNTIPIKRGIFQGDSLSALWFCLSLNPLSQILQKTHYGFEIKHQKQTLHKINHLMYMDDIKIYASSETQMKQLLKTVENITKDTCMEFGIDKCKLLHIEKGKWKRSEEESSLNNEIMHNMEQLETYQYLGFKQNRTMDHNTIKTHLITKYRQRLQQILASQLNSKNTFKAINTYAVPILTYSFGIIKWTDTNLDELNRITRTTLTKYRKHHPKACLERLYLPRDSGGRGLVDLKSLHNKQIYSLNRYFYTKTNSPMHIAMLKVDKNYTPLNLQNEIEKPQDRNRELLTAWSGKALHGKHINIIQDRHIDKTISYKWLKEGLIYPETEGFAIAIQDQVINTRNYRKYILKDPTLMSDTCRKCNIHAETIDHITSGCKLLAATDYTERHNNAGKIIHINIVKKLQLGDITEPYYKYSPQAVIENSSYKLYWDNPIHTDKTIVANRPDIVLIDKTRKKTYIIDIAIPNDHNINQKYREKVEKYTPLAQEIKRIWRQDTVIILPFIISVTGITPHTFIQNLQTIEIPTYIHSNIQKSVILNTTTIVRKFLQ